MLPCRLIVDPPLEGAWNMAVDDALLEQAVDGREAALRFYQWREPTLSLGYFQAYDERCSHDASHRLAVVRRQSGGGAIVHDRELTYSLVLPAAHPLARQSQLLYDVVHRSLVESLACEGIVAALHRDQVVATPANSLVQGVATAPEPFLCFARRAPVDVILPSGATDVTPPKIAGSAQRRRRGVVLQHGSVLLDRSPGAPELPGIEQASGALVPPIRLAEDWSRGLAGSLKFDLRPYRLSDDAALIGLAKQFHSEKYAADSWTRRR